MRARNWIGVVLLALAAPLFAAAAEPVKKFRMSGGIDVDDAPSGASLQTMSGSIRVRSLGRGAKPAALETYAGNIRVGAAAGSLSAITMSGDIKVHLVDDGTEAPRTIYLRSMSGTITVYLPRDFGAEADITLSYTQDYHGPVHIIDETGLPQTTTDNWEGTIGTPRKFVYARGKIGNGKDRIEVSTVNGDIILRREP